MNSHNENQITIERVSAFKKNRSLPGNAGQIDLNCPEVILNDFRNLLRNTPMLGCSFYNPYTNQIETLPDNADELTARHLQILARNERNNITGVMNTGLYTANLDDYQIAYLRTLVKATNVAGLVDVHSWGGYGQPVQRFEEPIKMIVVDQAGFQWQNDFCNTGGMFFYPDDPVSLPKEYTEWQQKAFHSLYGRDRPKVPSKDSLDVKWWTIMPDGSGRIHTVQGKVDLNLLSNAFAAEFNQAWDAVVQQGQYLDKNDKINFKFLKAGLGFFCENIVKHQDNWDTNQNSLEHARLKGILQVLQQIAMLDEPERRKAIGKIKRLELPYSGLQGASKPFQDTLNAIQKTTEALGLEWGGTPKEDVFVEREGYVNACTNCGDPHAMTGNEGGYSSVDAAMSSNANLDVLNVAFNPHAQHKNIPLGAVPVLSNLNVNIDKDMTDAQKKKKFLAQLVIALKNPECKRADILKEFEEMKSRSRSSKYAYIHTSSNPVLDKMRLFFKSKANNEDNFWHTNTYQTAIKLMKDAYLAKRGDDSIVDSVKENEFIDYVRGNAIIHSSTTSTRNSFK